MVQRNYTVGSPSGSYYEQKSQSGDDTPYALRVMGIFPVNKYTLTSAGFIRPSVPIYFSNGRLAGSASVSSYNVVVWSSVSWPNESDIINKLGDKWRNTDLNIGMYLSPEGRQSASLLGDTMKRLANSAIHLKRGDFGGFVRNLDHLPSAARKQSARKFNQGDISGAFLSAHLGWEPLIKDSYELANIEAPSETSHLITASKQGSRTFYVSGNTYTAQRLINRSSFKSFVKLGLEISRPPTFSERFGLGNPFGVFYENIPLSFVADYFLPIGSTIAAMNTISQLYGSMGYRKQLQARKTYLELPPGKLNENGTRKSLLPMTLRDYDVTFQRTKFTANFSAPLRSAKVSMPSSLTRLATLSALVHQSIINLR